MPVHVLNTERLRLPERRRVRRVPVADDPLLEELGRRVAMLPAAQPCCLLSPEGITVHGLGVADRHQVLWRGWGRLNRHAVVLHPPRDQQELEVCWAIIRHAHQLQVTAAVAADRPGRIIWSGDMPGFSRTTHH